MKNEFECTKRIVRLLAIEQLEHWALIRKMTTNENRVRELFNQADLLQSLLDDLEGAEHFTAQEQRLKDSLKIGGTD